MKSLRVINPLAASLLLSASLGATPQWTEASLSNHRESIAVCSTGSRAFFAGGIAGSTVKTRVDIYDADTGDWSVESLSVARRGAAATGVGNLVLIAGGMGGVHLDSVEIYDLTTETWTAASLSTDRAFLTAGTVGDLAFFAGGYGSAGWSDRVDIYSATTNTWSTASLSVPRGNIHTWTIGSRIFFAGGWANYTPFDVIDVYDTSTGFWSTMALPLPATVVGATVGDLVFLSGPALGDVVWIYDDSDGSWSTTHLSDDRAGLAVAAADGRVLFAGGTQGGNGLVTVDIYDTATGTWQVTALSLGRYNLAGTSVAGQALFAGGIHEWPGVSNVVDIYTPGPGHAFCFGDGTGQPCPCTNEGGNGRGCLNSSGLGALLTSFASASVTQADLGFTLSDAAHGRPALLFAGEAALDNGAGLAFGDGLRCAGGPIVRLSTLIADGEGTAIWDPAPSPTNGWIPGSVRYFQAYYRDIGGPCGSGFNTSNGVEIQFVP